MPEMIVCARKDGRGGIKPFGTYGKAQAGAMVDMGGKKYKVTKDGRVNIPKKIMNKYGIEGDDGRKRIAISFSSKRSTAKRGKASNHWKNLGAAIFKPDTPSKNLKTNDRPEYDDQDGGWGFGLTDELLPETDEDYTWS